MVDIFVVIKGTNSPCSFVDGIRSFVSHFELSVKCSHFILFRRNFTFLSTQSTVFWSHPTQQTNGKVGGVEI